MKVEFKTSNMTKYKDGELFKIGACLVIEMPSKASVTVRLTPEQWELLARSADRAKEGM